MKTLKIAPDSVIQAPPAGQPESPRDLPPETNPGATGSNAVKNTVSEGEILKPVEGSKISGFQPLTGSTPGSGLSSGTGQSVPLGGFLDAKLAIELVDAVVPSGLVIASKYAGVDVKKSSLQLTEKEKGVLNPVVQKCLDQLMLNFNSPWTALAVVACTIYGTKVTEHIVVAGMDQKQAKKEMRELEKKAGIETVITPAPTVQPAPVISIKEAAKEIYDPNAVKRIDPRTVSWQPDEQMIKAAVKKYKFSRVKAIAHLKSMYGKGQMKSIEALTNQ